MKKVFGFLTASLIISLATSAMAQSSVADVNSKMLSATAVSPQALPNVMKEKRFEAEKKNAFESRKEAQKDAIEARKMERQKAEQQREMERRQSKENKIADRQHKEVKDRVIDFRSNHPKIASDVVSHRDWFKDHGISPVKVISNPEKFMSFRDRMTERHGK